MHVGLFAVDLTAREAEANRPIVSAVSAAKLSGGANLVLRAVNRNIAFGAKARQTSDERIRPYGVLFRPQHRGQTVVVDRKIRNSLRVPTPRPDDSRQVGSRVSVGTLPGHQLERVNALRCELVLQRDGIFGAEALVETDVGLTVINGLWRIGIHSARVDVSAIGRLFRIGR